MELKFENTKDLPVRATNGGPQATSAPQPLFSQRQSGIDARNDFANAATEASVLTQFSPNYRGSKDPFFSRTRDQGLRSVKNQTVLHFGIRQKFLEQEQKERDQQRRFLGNAARIAIAEKNLGVNTQYKNEQARLAGERLGLQKDSLDLSRRRQEGLDDVRERGLELREKAFEEEFGPEAKAAEVAKAKARATEKFDAEARDLLKDFTGPSVASYSKSRNLNDLERIVEPVEKLKFSDRSHNVFGALRKDPETKARLAELFSEENIATGANNDFMGFLDALQKDQSAYALDDPEFALQIGKQALELTGVSTTAGPDGTKLEPVDKQGKSLGEKAEVDKSKRTEEIRVAIPGIKDEDIQIVIQLMKQGISLDAIIKKATGR